MDLSSRKKDLKTTTEFKERSWAGTSLRKRLRREADLLAK